MKKLLYVLVALLLCISFSFALCSCGSSSGRSETNNTSVVKNNAESESNKISTEEAERYARTALLDRLSSENRGDRYDPYKTTCNFATKSHEGYEYEFFGTFTVYDKYGRYVDSAEFDISVDDETGKSYVLLKGWNL